MYRKTYAQIDGDILENNAKEIIKKYKDYQYYIGVVKNNAYHHGIKVVNKLIQGGVNYLAVSSLDEAIEIRKYNTEIPILILEPISLLYIDDALNNKVTITVQDLTYLEDLKKMKLPYKLFIHLKIDSGMNRLGFKDSEEVIKAVEMIKENKMLFLEGIYTHFATSGVSDIYYDQQLKSFKELVSGIDLKEIPIVHVDRSLTLVRHEKIEFTTGVRLGIILFGFSGNVVKISGIKGKLRTLKRKMFIKKHHISATILENDLKIKPAFSLYSTVMSIRFVNKGEVVGYNTYKVVQDGFIATIPIGYADGVTKEFGFVFIHNKKYPIVSDAMDMIMVFVDDTVKCNDKVEIFGEHIPVSEVSQRLGINSYHLFNQIQNRVVRVHIENKEKQEVKY